MTKVVCVGLEFEQIVQGLFVPGTHKHKRRIARYDMSAVMYQRTAR